jgi:hypothetical protein
MSIRIACAGGRLRLKPVHLANKKLPYFCAERLPCLTKMGCAKPGRRWNSTTVRSVGRQIRRQKVQQDLTAGGDCFTRLVS